MIRKITLLASVRDVPPGSVCIYGTGGRAQALFKALDDRADVTVRFFLDSFNAGELLGKAIRRFPDLSMEQLLEPDHVIVASTYAHAIVPTLFDRGLAQCLIFDDTLEPGQSERLQLELDMRCLRDAHHAATVRPDFNERPHEYAFALKWLARTYPEEILDVGSGETAFPAIFRTCGFKTTAIDFSSLFNTHYPVEFGDITAYASGRSFDAVTCISTLEHVEDHDKAVDNMFALLRPGGVLILTIPYNERTFIKDIGEVPNALAEVKTNHLTRVFSGELVRQWEDRHAWRIVDRMYVSMFTGAHFGLGTALPHPVQVDDPEDADLLLAVFEKQKG